MKVIAGTLLAVFMAMALFSFGVIDSASADGGMAGCLASKIHNGVCPPESFSLDAAIFHTSAFQTFSVAVFSSFFAFFLLAAARFLAGAVLPSLSASASSRFSFAPVPLDFKSFRKKQRALSRRELSPTL